MPGKGFFETRNGRCVGDSVRLVFADGAEKGSISGVFVFVKAFRVPARNDPIFLVFVTKYAKCATGCQGRILNCGNQPFSATIIAYPKQPE